MEPGSNVPPEWAEELATAGEEEKKLGFPLNKVTVWFPCPECGGYVHSIPALQEHCRLDHDLPYVSIPKNCPQWAKDGKICFTYQPYNWGRGAKQKVSSEAVKGEKEGQIRIRNPSELMEKNSEEDVETSPNNQGMKQCRSDYVRNHSTNTGRLSSPPRVHSPPDSGMFDGGSEVVEDELPQQNKALKPNSGNSGGLPIEDLTHVDDKTKGQEMDKLEMGSRNNKDESKATTCSTCGKRFKTVAVLKAHCKKVHKKDTSSQQTLSSSKQPQSNPTTPEEDSEDSSTDDEMNNRERPRARSRRRINSSSSKSSPSSSATSSPEKVKTKAAVRGRSRGRATKRIPNYERDPDWGGLRRSSRNSSQVKRKRSSSPLSSNDYSESDEDPYKKKRQRRSLRKSTSASRTSRASKATSNKSSSSSSNSNTDSDNSSTHYSGSSSSEDEGELTDRSTTPEGEASQEKQSTEEEQISPEKEAPPKEPMVTADDGTSDSDSSDMFIAVMVTKKRTSSSSSGKNTVVIKQEADGPTDESSKRSTTVCNKCNLECHDTGELLAHIAKEHHKDTPEQIYLVCGYCQKRFSNKNKSGFNRHIKTHKKDEGEADQ